MRIFYLITKSEAGGAQTHVQQMAARLISQGQQVAVMAFPGGWLEKEIKKLGASFYPNLFLGNSFNPWLGFRAMKIIKQALVDFSPQLVSCHSSAAGFWGRMAVKNKIPTLFTAHGWGFALGAPFLRRHLMIILEKIAAIFCSKIICVSNKDRDLALRYKIKRPEQIITIHNGVEIQEINLEQKLLQAPFQIIFVGRLAPPKQQSLLIKAFSELPQDLQDKAEIILVGDGPQKTSLECLIRERGLLNKVKLLGQQDRERVWQLLQQAHIFAFLSLWEGFPRSILEAMSCGLAIVASDVGAVKEALSQGAGLVIAKNSKLALKQALIQLLKSPELIKKLGQTAKQRVTEYFSLEKMIRETEKVYQDMLRC